MSQNEDVERYLYNAAVAFADGCTLPLLTPNCPFYTMAADGPACGEQCREVADGLRAGDRPIATHRVGGLLMTGRELPLGVVAGMEPFDASRLYMKHRHLPVWQQSTSALLLGLKNATSRVLLGENKSSVDLAKAQWSELHKRQLPVPRVAAAGLSWEMASAAVSRAILPIMNKGLVVETGDVRAPSTENEWHAFLLVQYEKHSSTDSCQSSDGPAASDKQDIPLLVRGMGGKVAQAQISHDPIIRFGLSREFFFRLTQWFGRALSADMDWDDLIKLPSAAVFDGLDGVRYEDEFGQWLWDRFTQTCLSAWRLASLVRERQWQKHGISGGTAVQLLRERPLSDADVADAAFHQMESRTRAPVSTGFDPNAFVQRAIELLKEGNASAASEIFEGIVELCPTNPAAWNNLGFCQISFDAAASLYSLGRSAMFGNELHELRVANQMLALHLLGRDRDALLLEAMIMSKETEGAEAWVWLHSSPDECGIITEMDVRAYIEILASHIRAGLCDR